MKCRCGKINDCDNPIIINDTTHEPINMVGGFCGPTDKHIIRDMQTEIEKLKRELIHPVDYHIDQDLDYKCSECGVGINGGEETFNRKNTKVFCKVCAPHDKTTSVDTFFANIYVGLRAAYSDKIHSMQEIYELLQQYCNEKGYGVTVTPTTFIYKDGCELGAIVGINYPRFPSSFDNIENHASEIAMLLKNKLEQIRISIVYPDRTVMLGDK